jgi:hypothetical protein
LAFRPAKFDCDISTLDISGFAKTLAEGSYTAGERGRRLGAKISDHRHRRLLRARTSRLGHAQQTSAADQHKEVPPPNVEHRGSSLTRHHNTYQQATVMRRWSVASFRALGIADSLVDTASAE